MKIAIDCRLINEGGVGRYIRNLIYYLGKLNSTGNQFFLILPQNLDLKVQNSKLIYNSKFKILNSPIKWHSLNEQLGFYSELEKGNYDLVHFPYFSHPILYNRPFVITIHDLTILKFATGKATTKSYLTYLIKRFGYKEVLKHGIYKAKKIIVPSKTVKLDIVKQFNILKDKIAVTYEGVGYELQQAKAENCLPAGKAGKLVIDNYLLYVGNFYPHKNVEFLIKAFAKLDNQIKLVLAGPNNFFTKRIAELIDKLNIKNKVLIKSNLNDSELKYLYLNAKALVLPSLFEGFGLPIIEAVNFNCPLVLSDIPVFREIAPKQTMFFNPKKESELLNRLNQVLSKKKTKLVLSPDYLNNFSFKKMSKQTLEIYNSVLK